MKTETNDLIYFCAMTEYVSRITRNRRGTVVTALGKEGIEKELRDAQVNHCLSFEQVSEEWIDHYRIPEGDFETVERCRYSVPDYVDIGKLYAYLTEDISGGENTAETLISIFTSFLSDEISDFNTDLYYQNLSYLAECYYSGEIIIA